MKYVYGKKMKTLKDRLTTGFASLIILANSAGMSLPFLMSQRAFAATPAVTYVDAYYSSGTGYTGIGVDFKTTGINDASEIVSVKIGLNNFSDGEYSISGQNPLFSTVVANSAANKSTSGTVIITGSRTSGSGSWETMQGTWHGPERPDTAIVSITLTNGITYTAIDNTIVENSGNTEATVFATVPEITYVSAEYVEDSSPDYTGVWVDFKEKGVVSATDIELRLNRDDGTTYSIYAQSSVLSAVNAGIAEYETGGTVIITGSRTSGSWSPQIGTWDTASRLATNDPVEVIITLGNGTKLSRTVALESQIRNQAIEDNVFPIIVDTTPPTATLTVTGGKVVNGMRYVRPGDTIKYTVVADDESGLDRASYQVFRLQANERTQAGSICGSWHNGKFPEGSNTRTGSFTMTNCNGGTAPADGPYGLAIRVYDNAGNNLRIPNSVFYVDGAAPTITVKDDSVGDKDAGVFSKVSFKLFDAYKVDRLTLNGVEKDLSDNKWSDLNDVGVNGWFGEVEGLNTLVVYDVAGNSTTYEFTLDTTAPDTPVISLHATPSGDIILDGGITNSYGVVASWTFGPDDAGYEYRYFNSIPGDAYNVSNNHFYTTQPAAPIQSGSFTQGEGLHHLQVRAVDAAGNWSGWSTVFDVTYDATAPEIAGVVLNGESVSVARSDNCGPTDFNVVGGTINLSATITDNISGVKKAVYKIRKVTDGGCTQAAIYNSNQVTMSNTGADEWITLPGSELNTEDVPADGNYTIQITLTDNAGNAATKYVDITVDNTLPTAPTITAPGARTWHKTAPIVNSWTASEDTSGIAEYQVAYRYDDGHTFSNSTCPGETINGLALSGCRNTTGQSRNHTPGNNEQGGVTIWVRAIDNAGNKGPWSKSVHYYYDHEAPVTDINVSEVVDGVFTVSGNASDNEALNRVYVQLVSRAANLRCGGTTINLIPEGDTASWSKTYDMRTLMSVAASPVPCPEGEYAAHVSVVDMAGNTSSAGWTENFTVETLKPAVNGEHLAIAGGHISVGFNFANFKDISDVKVQLFNADGEIATNQGTSLLNDLLNGWGLSGGSVTSPFYLSDAPDDDYWVFDDTEWTEDTKPTYAVVTITGSNGDKSVTIEGLTNAGEDTYESLLAALNTGGNTNTGMLGVTDCDGDGITDYNGCENGAGSNAGNSNTTGGRGQGEADSSNGANTNNARGVLGESTGLSNTGSAINMFAAAAAALLGAALWIVRRKSAAN